jgi:hypothetical protein
MTAPAASMINALAAVVEMSSPSKYVCALIDPSCRLP